MLELSGGEKLTQKAKSNSDGTVVIDVGKAAGLYAVDVMSSAVFASKNY